MKKLLQLSLLLIIHNVTSQNAPDIHSTDQFFLPLYQEIISTSKTLADTEYSDTVDYRWMQEQIRSSSGMNPGKSTDRKLTNNFNSFLLIEQLEALNNKTPFHIEHNPTLERYIRVFLRSRKDKLAGLMDRARYYFPLFEKKLDKYDLPLEIKYLAVIESALKPLSASKAGARGLWQFMYTTGKHFGLEINSLVDERYDPVRSTEAACKFLKKLYDTFGEWDLALAAYNSGPGNVTKAIRRAGGNKNYWEIRQYLPRETQGYLPAFYATYYLFEYRDFHNIESRRSSISYFETDTIQIKKQIDFKSISKVINIDQEILKALNPQYKNGIIPFSKTHPYTLILPKKMIGEFIQNEKLIYSDHKNYSHNNKRIKINRSNSHLVLSGESLNSIAKKYRITLHQLKEWNGLQTDYLIKGQHLVVTDQREIDSDLVSAVRLKKPESSKEKEVSFTVNRTQIIREVR